MATDGPTNKRIDLGAADGSGASRSRTRAGAEARADGGAGASKFTPAHRKIVGGIALVAILGAAVYVYMDSQSDAVLPGSPVEVSGEAAPARPSQPAGGGATSAANSTGSTGATTRPPEPTTLPNGAPLVSPLKRTRGKP